MQHNFTLCRFSLFLPNIYYKKKLFCTDRRSMKCNSQFRDLIQCVRQGLISQVLLNDKLNYCQLFD